MRTFHCENCGNPVYFENSRCTRCHAELGVVPEVLRVSALQQRADGTWRALTRLAGGRHYRKCENYRDNDVCNWMVATDSDEPFCIACRLNRTIPNLGRPGFRERWYRLERSKRRLVYSLMKLGLPLHSKQVDPDHGLAFSFLSNADAPADSPVMTGHANGHITINIDEADPALRERSRVDMQEKYRTLLGHFRHESGHYYWDLLIAGQPAVGDFRRLFGDERRDYAEALERHYRDGPPAHWQQSYISHYASSHPWEDWAETWAHYLHIVDTLETASHYGVRTERRTDAGLVQPADPSFDAYRVERFGDIIAHWIPLTQALNSLNRSMGLPDLYPFVLATPAIDKLAFIHDLLRRHRQFDLGYAVDMDHDPPSIAGDTWRHWLGRLFGQR
jgi:hypothetical protein